MPKETRSLVAFNRGLISRRGTARVDLPRTALSAETMVNWMPRSLGPMSLRVGSEYIDNSLDDAVAMHLPFVFSTNDKAHLEFTDSALRVRVDDELIERPTVTAQTTNGGFTGGITGWTVADEGSAVSSGSSDMLRQTASGTSAAIVRQEVTVNEASTVHALRVVVARGPVILLVGSTSGDDDYIEEITLGTGTHSLAFTPTGNFHITVMNRRDFYTFVDSITVESSGAMELPTPWGEDDLPLIRAIQNGNVIYTACQNIQQYKIIRSGAQSWGVEKYEPETGPFRTINVSPITLAAGGLDGNITITASKPFFKTTNVGSLFRIESAGQTVQESAGAEDTFTEAIRVSGVESERIFAISVSDTFSATVTLQRSIGEPGAWTDVTSYTVETSTSFDDGLDNQVIYYRIGIKAGDFTSGNAELVLTYANGTSTGIARVTAYTSPTSVNAVVLRDFGSTAASSDWWEGKWSDRRGWPTAVCLHELRMGMFGKGQVDLSITDQFEDFDDEFEGDAGPINRSIAEGPVDIVTWALSLSRLVLGTLANSANVNAVKIQGNNPLSCRSSSFDEPLTPTNFNIKTSAPTGVFVDTSLTRLMELVFDVQEGDYVSQDLCIAVPDLNEVGIAQVAVQYKPDLRIWCRREDGTCAVVLRDRAENVLCWFEIETDGVIEDVSVMPDPVEDRVYWSVRRGSERYLEKLALESECVGGDVNKQADAFVTGTNSPASTTISGLPYPDGTEVIAWADGVDLSPDNEQTRVQTTYTVASGAITVGTAVTNWCVGLPYEARWKSGKLAFAAALGTALNVPGKNARVGFILQDTHARGLWYGDTFETLYPLPLIEDDAAVDPDTIHSEYDEDHMPIESDWDSDPRVCLVARAPRPCTVKALTVHLNKNG